MVPKQLMNTTSAILSNVRVFVRGRLNDHNLRLGMLAMGRLTRPADGRG